MGIPMELKGSDELEIIYSYSVRFTVCEISSILDLTGDLGKKREKKIDHLTGFGETHLCWQFTFPH